MLSCHPQLLAPVLVSILRLLRGDISGSMLQLLGGLQGLPELKGTVYCLLAPKAYRTIIFYLLWVDLFPICVYQRACFSCVADNVGGALLNFAACLVHTGARSRTPSDGSGHGKDVTTPPLVESCGVYFHVSCGPFTCCCSWMWLSVTVDAILCSTVVPHSHQG